MAISTITTDLLQAFEVVLDFAPQVTFVRDLVEFRGDFFYFIIREVIRSFGRIDFGCLQDLYCGDASDTVDIGQSDRSRFVRQCDS